MVCGTCGVTIAEKAIVCYRCGTATAIPVVAKPTRPTTAPRSWSLVIVLAVCAAAAVWLALASPAGTTRQMVWGAAAVVAATAGVYIAWRRRA